MSALCNFDVICHKYILTENVGLSAVNEDVYTDTVHLTSDIRRLWLTWNLEGNAEYHH